ncbi:MAG: T9SS type A sorting domain-containing protein [Candidatus Neomarinimicrobiota bacterium]
MRLFQKFFALHQNYPNPFNPTTKITYDIPEISNVTINIYDVIGRNIKSFIEVSQVPGTYSIHWDATNHLGDEVSAGMYIYTISAGDFMQSRKMVLLK